MSRIKKLNERKKRKQNKLKITIGSLALTLVIGSTQALGTYALFTDAEDFITNLSISTGDVDVLINGDGFNGEEIEATNKPISKEFKIKNHGTLKQNLKVQLNFTDTHVDKSVLEKISYKLESIDNKFKTIEMNMADLATKGITIIDNNNNPITLNYSDELSCKATITVNEDTTLQALNGKIINFKLKLTAEQINFVETGFYDVYEQSNSIRGKKELGPNESEVIFKDCPCGVCINNATGKRAQAYEIDLSSIFTQDQLNHIYAKTIVKQEYVNGSGTPEENNDNYFVHLAEIGSRYMYIGHYSGDEPSVDAIVNRKLKIEFSFESADPITYIVTFKKDGEKSFIAEWEGPIKNITNISNKDTLVPSIKEDEIIEPNQPEITEPPKEDETIEPNQPEITEPPKKDETTESNQPEIIEPPKEDETTGLNQPGITEPPNEYENIK